MKGTWKYNLPIVYNVDFSQHTENHELINRPSELKITFHIISN